MRTSEDDPAVKAVVEGDRVRSGYVTSRLVT